MRDDGLPLELVDEILALSQHDFVTLKSCMAVSRTWNSLVRGYIFRRVHITDGERLDAFESLIAASPEIAARVRELHFGPFTPPKTYRASMPWVARIPRVLPRLCTGVRTVRFERLNDAAEYCDAAFFRAFHGFASATALVLDDSALNIPTLLAFACALPRLATLVVRGLLPLMVTVWAPPPRVAPPRFTALHLDFAVQPSTTMADFLDWLQQSDARHTVRALDLAVKVLDAKPVNQLLARVGPRLEHLGLKLQALFSSTWEFDVIKGSVSIAPCRNLTSLALHNPTCAAMLAFLREAPTEHLRTVALHVDVAPPRAPAAPVLDCGFDELAEVVEGARFRRLQCVRVVQEGAVPCEELLPALEEAFPKLKARDVLRVVYAPRELGQKQ